MTSAENLFCIGCQTQLPESQFELAPPTRKWPPGRKYKWECLECQRKGLDVAEQKLLILEAAHTTECLDCFKPTDIDADGLCRKCQKKRGFKYCNRCNQKRLADMDFYPGRAECVDCSEMRQRSKYVQCPKCKLWGKRGKACARPSCQNRPCLRCKLDKEASHSKICIECKKKAHKPLSCRWCKKTEIEIEFFSARICIECNKKTADELRNQAKLKSALKKYGMTIEEYQRLVQEQGGVCRICSKSNIRRLGVDRDYRTGKVRGLLCVNCNLGLGNFLDSAELLEAAKEYLNRA